MSKSGFGGRSARRVVRIGAVAAAVATSVIVLIPGGPASAASIPVTTTADVIDAAANCAGVTIASLPGPGGTTSLREAVCAANNTAGDDAISFSVNGTFTLAGTAGDDAGDSGDLDVTSTMTIQGNGSANTVIDAGLIERIFDVFPGSPIGFTLADLTVQHGDTRTTGFKQGGAIYLHNNVTATLTDVHVVNNLSGANGAIDSLGSLTMSDSVISGNQTEGGGSSVSAGGIRIAGPATITNGTISNNSVEGEGGGAVVTVASGQTVAISGTTFSNNSATVTGGALGNGGAIATTGNDGTLNLTNVTISGNRADNNGGGAYIAGTGSVHPTNVTITNNTADFDNNASGTGGGIHHNSSTVTLLDTIVAGNFNSTAAVRDDIAGASGGSNNLVGDGTGSSGLTNGANGNVVGSGASPVDPLLDTLAANGGTTLTHALLAGSPAINAGDNATCAPTDQRGIARSGGGATCDIGAYELVDAIPPDTTITANPTNPSASANASFSVTGSDSGGSGLAGFECQLDGSGFSACTSPQSYIALADGSHTFQVRAVDGAGNLDPTPASFTWMVDATGPDTTITATPSNPTNSTTASFSFTGNDGGGTGVASFQCQLDGGAFNPCTSPETISGLIGGMHMFAVRGIDVLGTPDPTPATFTWEIDLTSPETLLTAMPTNPTNSVDASFEFDSSEPGATFECSLDGEPFASCTSPKPYVGLSEGVHAFEVQATDSAGNVDPTPATYTWLIDVTAPDSMISTTPPNPSNSADAGFSFTGDDSTGSGVASFECQLDGGGFGTCTSPQSYTGLSYGSHTFEVRAVDGAGNVDGSPATYTWTIDTIDPTTTITSTPSDPSASADATFEFNGDGTGTSVTFECSLDGATFTTCTSPQAYTGLTDGSHTFDVRAVDAADNVDSTPASYTWTIDTGDPTTSITTNPPNPTGSPDASFSFTGADAGGSGVASFECSLDAASFATCTSPVSFTSLSNGTHTFQVRAVDDAGNIDASPAAYTWLIDTVAPVTTIDSRPPALTANTSATITFSGSDPDLGSGGSGSEVPEALEPGSGVASFECSLDGAPFTTCTNPVTLTGLANGSHTFLVRAVDGAGNEDASPASITWTVNTSAGPTLTATKTVTGTFQPGGAVTYTIVVTNNGSITQQDNPGDELVDVLPASLQLVSAMATSGTATADGSTRTVHWNGSLAPSASVTITVSATILTSATPGQTISNQASLAFDADDNGTNESSAVSGDGSQTGTPTDFVLSAAPTTPTTTAPGGGLPPTGSDHTRSGLTIALVLLAIGSVMIGVRRRRAH